PFIAYALIVIGGFFKYYPITMLVVAVRERISGFMLTIGAAICAIVLYAVIYQDELRRGLPLVATGSYFADLFGAKNLPLGIATLWPVSGTL
ncbi:hypothetical protein OVW21_26575, partial [Klebsiella pneumoniae]|uniref:hypothetical protein n=1 Tax=Klebsiella pneumoniae TaxID=573 RepID=UPI002271ED35